MKSVAGWYVIFQILSVICVMLTVGTGAGTIITGYIANRRQSKAIADAGTAAANAQAEAAKLQISVADAETKRADAERALLELQERLKPRAVTSAQREKIAVMLAGSPRRQIAISFVLSSPPQVTSFAQQLYHMFKELGYNVSEPGSRALLSYPAGLLLKCRDANAPPSGAVDIQKALTAAGYPTELGSGEVDPDIIVLFVGPKE